MEGVISLARIVSNVRCTLDRGFVALWRHGPENHLEKDAKVLKPGKSQVVWGFFVTCTRSTC